MKNSIKSKKTLNYENIKQFYLTNKECFEEELKTYIEFYRQHGHSFIIFNSDITAGVLNKLNANNDYNYNEMFDDYYLDNITDLLWRYTNKSHTVFMLGTNRYILFNSSYITKIRVLIYNFFKNKNWFNNGIIDTPLPNV